PHPQNHHKPKQNKLIILNIQIITNTHKYTKLHHHNQKNHNNKTHKKNNPTTLPNTLYLLVVFVVFFDTFGNCGAPTGSACAVNLLKSYSFVLCRRMLVSCSAFKP
ncbi:hypothetical protein, partial [Coleofasciculus sp. E2-BRE-01]|uniref:hypothetical protein n=1 Tax=Coleofasciculus sp. E2-BRE-01 TaxID=3069524 RepID=UPI0032F6DAE1